MELNTICSYCSQSFNVADSMIERETVARGERLVLTILICPHCHEEAVVQIDNDRSLQLYQQQLELGKQIGKRKYLYGHPTSSQESRRANIEFHLSNLRESLVKRYNGTFYQFNGKYKKLEYHQPKVEVIGGK